jgi:hypothetical protein
LRVNISTDEFRYGVFQWVRSSSNISKIFSEAR